MQFIDSLDDPRISHYRDLKDRELAKQGGLFIAESELVVRRLLASDYPVQSVLLARRRSDGIAPLVPADVPVYVVPDELIHKVVGFKFHSGVIAVGRRKPVITLQQIIPSSPKSLTLIICPETSNTENIGSIIRIASAFGASGMILGENCCDPFYRQSIRVSMGTIFHLPILCSDNLLRDMKQLREQWGVNLIATVLDNDAESLAHSTRPDRIGLLLGNEAQGLGEKWITACDRRITIPMKLGTDSLNVAVASALFLFHFTHKDC